MLLLTSLVTALIAPFVLSAPSPSKSGPPPGYQTVKDTCTPPAVLYCCNGTAAGGVAGEPSATFTGCQPAMVGNPPSVSNESGYCPAKGSYIGVCCTVVVTAGVVTGCGLPTQS